MNIFSLQGAMAWFSSNRVNKIGAKNIEGLIRDEHSITLVTYPDNEGKRLQYKLMLTMDGYFRDDVDKLDKGFKNTKKVKDV